MARQAKSLEQLVADRTFLARRHRDLLAGPTLPDIELAQLQARFAAAAGEAEQRAVSVEFERIVRRRAAAPPEEEAADLTLEELFAAQEELGPVELTGTQNRRYRRRGQRIASTLISYALGRTATEIAGAHAVTARTVSRDLDVGLSAKEWGPGLARCAEIARRRLDASQKGRQPGACSGSG
jgi:hypothetical protein